MIFLVILFIVVMIAFSEIGLAALLVLPMVAGTLVAMAAFIGLLMGAPGSGTLFLWSALPVGAVFSIMAIASKSRD